jgi:uncharacterized damage-inducible protein DinB
MSIAQSFIHEMDQEAKATRRLLERVPEGRLTWKPHPKSMSLGQLAMHLATINGNISGMGEPDVMEINPAAFAPPQPSSTQEILAAFDQSLSDAKDRLGNVDDERAMASWSATLGGKTLMAMPRAALYRAIMCSHQYHHRGQLSVYLRLLDVSIPSIYGPSADENPFM